VMQLENRVRLASDTGQFVIQALDGVERLTGPEVPENSLVRLEPADLGWVTILTGSQWGPFEVTVRTFDSAPDIEADGWEDVAEVSVEAARGLVLDEIPNNDPISIVGHGGQYRIRIKTRGRATGRSRDDDPEWDPQGRSAVVERYLVEVWPAPITDAVVIVGCGPAKTPAVDLHYDDLPELVPGMAAARWMTTALNEAAAGRRLSGDRGALSVERIVPGTHRQLFPSFWANHGSVVGGMIGGLIEEGRSWRYPHSLFVPAGGHIRLVLKTRRRRRGAVMEWNWFAPQPGERHAMADQAVPVLEEPTEFETCLEALEPDDHGARCRARIDHRNLPAEWLSPMRDYWELHLAVIEHWEQLATPEAYERLQSLYPELR
jgi:hypothetical protein